MNKKGFSLVELLAVIALLSIIISIAVGGYKGVERRLKKESYENKISYIETMATKYTNDTGYVVTNVDQLVKLGYITADNEKGDVLDPRDGKTRLNCNIVNITKDTENYYGDFTENIECNIDNLELINEHLEILAYETEDDVTKSNELEKNKWTKKNVILEAKFKDGDINPSEVAKIEWISNVKKEKVDVTNFENQKTYLVKAEQIINTNYSVIITMKNGTIYQASTNVKIDKQRPVIYDNEIAVEKKNEWMNAEGRTIEVSASDGNGSGIYGYYIGNSTTDTYGKNCTQIDISLYQKNENQENTYKKTLTEEGTYYLCVRDNVGNFSEDISSKEITIDKIDKTSPVCELSAIGTMGANDYYISNVDIEMTKQEDKESGVNHILIDYPKVDWDTNGLKITGTIVDNVGNTATCKKDIKIDRSTPKVQVKNSDLKLGNGDYDFKDNLITEFGISGGEVECNPPRSLKSGTYTTTCTATGTNGLTKTVSFSVKHNYPAPIETISATSHPEPCCCRMEAGYCGTCHGACTVEDGWVNENNEWCDNCCCVPGCTCPNYTCPGGYNQSGASCWRYYCPYGGYLSGTTCYY